jgi:ATP-binding cassette subfamily F protein uup
VQPGNYSYYLEKKLERSAREQRDLDSPDVAKPIVLPPSRVVRQRTLSFKERRELESMEAAILAAEARVRSLEATLNDASFYVTRAAEAPALVTELEMAKTVVSRLYTRWEQLDQIAR